MRKRERIPAALQSLYTRRTVDQSLFGALSTDSGNFRSIPLRTWLD